MVNLVLSVDVMVSLIPKPVGANSEGIKIAIEGLARLSGQVDKTHDNPIQLLSRVEEVSGSIQRKLIGREPINLNPDRTQ